MNIITEYICPKLKLLVMCFFFASCGFCQDGRNLNNKRGQVIVGNPSSVKRVDELVVLTREMIEQATGKIAEGKYIQLVKDDQFIPIQFDDLDKDGVWDESVFLYTFQPNQQVKFELFQSNQKSDQTIVRAHVRMREKNADNTFGPSLDTVSISGGVEPTDFSKQKLPPFLTEGPSWENDKVAYRLYFDKLNAKDIYGKIVPGMVMDTVGINPSNSYHKLSNWGMDILAVGQSLGAGSLALLIPRDNGNDTLVRLGGDNMERMIFEKIADGPIRGIFKMYYKNWVVANGLKPINVTEEISIWGGKYFYQNKVTVSGAPQAAKLVTGIVNLKNKNPNHITIGNCKILYTYGIQSENNDKLGLAVLVRNADFNGFGVTPHTGSDILDTYIVSLPIVASRPSVYRFYSAWERSNPFFSQEENFKRYLHEEAEKYANPLKILVQ